MLEMHSSVSMLVYIDFASYMKRLAFGGRKILSISALNEKELTMCTIIRHLRGNTLKGRWIVGGWKERGR